MLDQINNKLRNNKEKYSVYLHKFSLYYPYWLLMMLNTFDSFGSTVHHFMYTRWTQYFSSLPDLMCSTQKTYLFCPSHLTYSFLSSKQKDILYLSLSAPLSSLYMYLLQGSSSFIPFFLLHQKKLVFLYLYNTFTKGDPCFFFQQEGKEGEGDLFSSSLRCWSSDSFLVHF